MGGKGIPTNDVLREHAYLIARGTRALALVGQCRAEPVTMLRMATRLERFGETGVLPFVFDQRDGYAIYGYAASSWALDLFRWIEESRVPGAQRHRILGMMLGYSVGAIRDFEERQDGRYFDLPSCPLVTELPVRASSRRNSCT